MKMSVGRTLAAAALVVLAMSGCGGGSDDDGDEGGESGSGATTTAAPTKKLDAATWWVFYRPPLTLDPVKFDDYPEGTILGNLCEPLLKVNSEFHLVPHLASEVDSSDPANWKFTIRSGVKFWDGSEMTADDVLFSLRRNLDPTNASILGLTTLQAVKSITKTGPDEVTVSLKAPDVTFGDRMSTGAGAVMSERFSKSAGDKLGTPDGKIMCTGPFELESWDGATKLTATRNDGYWDKKVPNKLGKITFVWPQDPALIANSLESGEFDGAFNVPPSTAPQLKRSAAGTLTVGTPEQTTMVESLAFINTKGSAAESTKVRQALNLAIDRDALIAAGWNDLATPAYTLAPSGFWGYARDVFEPAYDKAAKPRDVEAAKSLVAEAGAIAKQPIIAATPAGQPLSIDQMSIVQQNAREIGLDFRIKTVPPEQYGALFSDPKAREGYTLLMTIGYTHTRNPLIIYDDVLGPNGLTNLAGYNNPKVNDLLARAKAETDDQERAKLTVQVQDLFLEDLPFLPMVAPNTTLFQGDGVTGAPVTFTYVNSPWAAMVGGK
jgi:peptide/nickel transport system substrate-binding protein